MSYLHVYAIGRALILSASTLLLGSCGTSTLSVKVSSLDPAYLERYRVGAPIETIVSRARQAEEALAESGALSPVAINERANAVRVAVDKLVASEAFGEGIRALLSDDLKTKLGAVLSSPVRADLLAASERLATAVREVRKAQKLSLSELEDALELYLSAGRTFAAVDGTVAGVADKARDTLKANLAVLIGAESDEQKKAQLQAELNVVASIVTDRIDKLTEPQQQASAALGADILGDPLLGYVLRAPQKSWTGLLNLATTHVVGSNSDVAIVMDDVGKFSVKGIRANSTAATAAAFTTLTSVMDIAAVAAGVPVPGIFSPQKPADGSNSMPTTNPLISRTQIEQTGRFARLEMVRLLQIILAEGEQTLDSADDAAITAMRTRVAGGLQAFVGSQVKE